VRTAIYTYHGRDTGCPSCNQAGAKLIQYEIDQCKAKATEVFGEGQTFTLYVDTDDRYRPSKCLKEAPVRMKMEQLLEDIRDGKVDLVVMNYMGSLAADYMFVLAFYMYLRKNKVRLITVREGQEIESMMERALEEYAKAAGLEVESGSVEAEQKAEEDTVTISMLEIDGSTRQIVVTEASDAFLRLPGGSLDACEREGLKLYRDDRGEMYLADRDKNVVAMNIVTIRAYITHMIK